MLILQNGMDIPTVQNIFHDSFPYLKLEFFSLRHPTSEGKGRNSIPRVTGPLSNKIGMQDLYTVCISENMTVTELEKLFEENFGLSVQVLRKSGRSWLETALTDDWTLEKQNSEGHELSGAMP